MAASALGADHAGGQGVRKAERIAQRHHPLAHLEGRRIRPLQRRQVARRNLQHRHVGFRVSTFQTGDKLAPVLETHADAARLLHHVMVGEHVGAGLAVREDEARSLADGAALLSRRGPRQAGEIVAEETAEEIIVERPALPFRHLLAIALLLHLDEGHRRRHLFRHRGERLAGLAQAVDAAVASLDRQRQQEKGKEKKQSFHGGNVE